MTTRPYRRALVAVLLLAAVASGPVAVASPALGAPVVRGADSPEEDSRDAQREGQPQPNSEDSPEVGEDEGLEVKDATGQTWLSVLVIAACSAIVMGAGALRRPGGRGH